VGRNPSGWKLLYKSFKRRSWAGGEVQLSLLSRSTRRAAGRLLSPALFASLGQLVLRGLGLWGLASAVATGLLLFSTAAASFFNGLQDELGRGDSISVAETRYQLHLLRAPPEALQRYKSVTRVLRLAVAAEVLVSGAVLCVAVPARLLFYATPGERVLACSYLLAPRLTSVYRLNARETALALLALFPVLAAVKLRLD